MLAPVNNIFINSEFTTGARFSIASDKFGPNSGTLNQPWFPGVTFLRSLASM